MEKNKEPSLIDKAKNLGEAVIVWAKDDKFKKVPPEIFQYRKSICLACPHWDPEAFTRLGKCKLCGCSVVKLYLPSSVCPDKRWDSASESNL